ncbi:MAG TPA: histone deacetylase family protein [Rhizomicrobium sp.]|jgi:acetoin utilization deacetylase AcuC-like enzyme
MTTGLFTHSACFEHVTPPGHPERVERLQAVLNALDSANFPSLVRMEAPRADRDSLLRAHERILVDEILSASIEPQRFVRIDADTTMSAGSREAAVRAAGAVIGAVDEVMAGRFVNAFCAVRPPGHHAERARPMGFCLFNNIAIGALHARATHGLDRVAVIDFDVHHGNGTQDIFYNDPDLFYASTHQSPLYPGTGFPSEQGIADNILNVPLPPEAGSAPFRAAFEEEILPSLEAFSPHFLFISAGFDAHYADPLASLRLNEADFEWATGRLCDVAARICDGRVVSALEGGYDLEALARSAAAHVSALVAGGSR